MKTRPIAELLTIGTELVTGSTVNTNAAYLGRELTKLGLKVEYQSACRDEQDAIHSVLRLALSRSDVIFICGGLGPTPDDITRECIADFFRVPLAFSKKQYAEIRRRYRLRDKKVPSIVKRESYFPANARPVFNQFGIALGFIIEKRERSLIALPGVPGELTRLFESRILDYLRGRFPNLEPLSVLVVKTVGLSEPSIMKRLGRAFFEMGAFQFGIYPETGQVSLRIYADSSAVTRRLKRWIARVLGSDIYSFADESLESVIGKDLKAKRWTVSAAESCTGGRIAERISSVPGASAYFKGGVVAYHNGVKSNVLGVPEKTLEKWGAVSKQVALEMAQGIRRRLGSTLGLAVTGIAGPTGGSTKKPVGLVYIAIATAEKSRVWEERFGGDREHIQTRAAIKALEYLWRWIRRKSSAHS